MDANAKGTDNAHYRTTAEIVETLRFNHVLATLDPPTATLLRQERMHWMLAEIARRQELARWEERDRLLGDLAAATW